MDVASISSPWYLNPFFMTAFGVVTALGCVIFALAYFVFVRLKVMNTSSPTVIPVITNGQGSQKLTDAYNQFMQEHGELLTKTKMLEDWMSKHSAMPAHGGILERVIALENWRMEHLNDYRDIIQRLNRIERSRRNDT